MQQASTHILLVIEELETRSQLRKQLKNLGYWVAESTLDLASEVVAAQAPDLVLLGASPAALDFLRNLRGTAVLVVEQSGGLLDLPLWLEAGARDVLNHPFEPALVKARSAAALAWNQLRQSEVDTVQGLDLVARALAYEEVELDPLLRRGGSWAEIGRHLRERPPVAGQGQDLEELKRELHSLETQSQVSGRVLVVEDDAVSRKMLTLHLEHRGYEVSVAEDGLVAMELLAKNSFDAILLDQMMPRLDGYGVLQRLKADPLLQDVPVIVISANEAAEDVIRLIEMGAQDHLVKPYNVRLLDARLRSSLMSKKMRDQELEYIRGVTALTQAAAAIESEDFRPDSLNELALRKDAIGRLGRVFQGMAREILTRQNSLKRQLGELKSELEAARGRAERGDKTQTDYSQTLESGALKTGGVHIHVLTSFRGGTGTSTVAANLGVQLASAGYQVAVLDFALENPGLHSLFGLTGQQLGDGVHDLLLDRTDIDQLAMDLTTSMGIQGAGSLKLIPASNRIPRLARVLRQGYEPHSLTQALDNLVEKFKLDFLLIDTQAGLNEELVLCLLLANSVSLILRADGPDLEGAGVLFQVAHKLKVDKIHLLLNQVAPQADQDLLRGRLQDTFGSEVAALLPRFENDGQGIRQPNSPWAEALRALTVRLLQP